MNMFFVADTHFNHKNIITYCNRPFDDIDNMNEILIQNWNSVVKNTDMVMHLGDFAFGNDYEILINRLNGHKFLILGNHDNLELAKNAFKGNVFNEFTIVNTKPLIYLNHFSHRVWVKSHKGSYHLYGHSHGKLQPLGNSFDVGVDCNDYTPIHYDDMVLKMKSLSVG